MAVEYALAISVVLVASIGAINALQDSAADNLTTHGATAGAPDLPDAGIPITTSTTSPAPTTPPTAPPPGSVTATASFTNTEAGSTGTHRWSPSVDVTAVDASTGEILTSVTVTVRWTKQPSGEQVVQTFTVPSTGVVTFQLIDLRSQVGHPQYVDSVLVEIVSVTGTNPVINYTPDPSTNTTLDGPDT